MKTMNSRKSPRFSRKLKSFGRKFKKGARKVLKALGKLSIKTLILIDKLVMYIFVRLVFLLILVYAVAGKLLEIIKPIEIIKPKK